MVNVHQGAKIACCDVCNGTDHEFSHDAETLCYVRIKFLQYEMKFVRTIIYNGPKHQ